MKAPQKSLCSISVKFASNSVEALLKLRKIFKAESTYFLAGNSLNRSKDSENLKYASAH